MDENVDKTPVKDKGRPKGTPKKKGFRGTPRKLQKVDEQNVELTIMQSRTAPLGLKNYSGHNVCFFNSVIQVLFSVESFREHIRHLDTIDPIVLIIKNLFREIESSDIPIETYLYVQSLELSHYQPGVQFDAPECLQHILNNVYPSPDNWTRT